MERKEQDRRLKTTVQGDNNNNQPQKCPRCESINTKFCYYNNYSLSQPRYFCKTCRRYWTQGGTLRNVPVGGGCRKGKRLKTSASSSPSPAENFRPQSQPQQLNLGPNSAANSALYTGLSSNKESDQTSLMNPQSIGSFYPAGGFLSSLAAIQSLSNANNSITQQQSFPQLPPVNHLDPLGGGIPTSNLILLNGFNAANATATAPFGSNQQRPFYPIGNQNWQPFNSNPIVPDTALWSTISTSTTAANSNSNINMITNTNAAASAPAASFPLNPPNDNQWQEFSSYGNCPP